MKSKILTSIFILIAFSGKSQYIDCDSVMTEYCGGIGCILDTDAFCDGVKSALNYEGLAIRSLGDTGHVDDCTYLSYKKYGVALILTGDIVMPGQEDENRGFNAIMIPKIKDSLGAKYDLLGKTDSSWNNLSDQEFIHGITTPFVFNVLSDSTVNLVLDPNLEQESIFQTFEGIQFADHNGDWYDSKLFYEGVVLSLCSKERLYLGVNFESYSNPNDICNASNTYLFPVLLE